MGEKHVLKEKSNNRLYGCKICGLAYKTQELAQKCEAFCKENNACSLEITKHAVNK